MDPLNKEFIQLFEASKLSQVEVARMLDLTPAGVNHIIRGRNKPSLVVLRLFRMLLDEETRARGGAPKPERWERKVIEMLRQIPERDRDRVVETLKNMVELTRKRKT